MEFNGILVVSYIIATILFILALGGLSNQETARRGNWYGIVGMVLAGLAIFITAINIVGGFAVTQRMLRMFRK